MCMGGLGFLSGSEKRRMERKLNIALQLAISIDVKICIDENTYSIYRLQNSRE